MVKYLYIKTDNVGVQNKINNQIAALNELGIETVGVPLNKERITKRMIPFQTSSADWKSVDILNSDGLYIRYPFTDFQLIRLLKQYRTQRADGRIIMEIPAYPNRGEKYKNKVVVWRDCFYRSQLHHYINHIVYEGDSDYDQIFEVPATRIINGINVEGLPLKKSRNTTDDTINLICVASFYPEYGMDRVIRGMSTYYKGNTKGQDIMLHLVGRGPELDRYVQIAQERGIEDKVIIHGYKTGKELDEMFDMADIGVDAIALHRKGLKVSSTLKTREYMARGLPFLYSSEMPGLADEMKVYTLYAEPGEDEISMDAVLKFFNRLNCDPEKEKKIREIARKTVDMKVVMKPVADLLRAHPQ